MDSRQKSGAFPYLALWEEFDPDEVITWDAVERIFEACETSRRRPNQSAPVFHVPDVDDLRSLVASEMEREPNDSLIEKLQWLAMFQGAAVYYEQATEHLNSRRGALQKLERAANSFFDAADGLPAEVDGLMPVWAGYEPNRLLREDEHLDFDYVRRAAHDVALAAARAIEAFKPKTGRRPETRRDATIRLAAEAIEAALGEPVAVSRGTAENPAPHFTNAGGALLRRFIVMLIPKTDERVIAQSLDRSQRLLKAGKNSAKTG